MKLLRNYLYLLMILFTFLLLICIVYLFVKLEHIKFSFFPDKTIHDLSLNEWGDYIGGIYGTIVSFLAFIATVVASILVYQTLKTQRAQLSLQKRTEFFTRVADLINGRITLLNKEIESFKFICSYNEHDEQEIYNGWDAIERLNYLTLYRLGGKEYGAQFKGAPTYEQTANSIYNDFETSAALRKRLSESLTWFFGMISSLDKNFNDDDKDELINLIKFSTSTMILSDFLANSNIVLQAKRKNLTEDLEQIEKDTKITGLQKTVRSHFPKLDISKIEKELKTQEEALGYLTLINQ